MFCSRLLKPSLLSICLFAANVQSAEIKTLPQFDAGKIDTLNKSALLDGQDQQTSLNQILNLQPNNNLEEIQRVVDSAGNEHTKYQQTYKGLPVLDHFIVVHRKNGQVYNLHGEVIANLAQDISDKPIISEQQALNTAKDAFAQSTPGIGADRNIHYEEIKLAIFIDENNAAKKIFAINFVVSVGAEDISRPFFIIDAHTGTIIKQWEGLMHVEATGPGGNEKTGLYHYGTDKPSLQVTETSGTCLMENDIVKTFDLANFTGDFNNLWYFPATTAAFSFPCYENSGIAINGAYSPLNDAHYFSMKVVEMYQTWFGVSPLTLNSKLIVLTNTNFANAGWNGRNAWFGNGNGTQYPYTTLDVVSHEIAHSFTQINSNIYNRAIQESFSDIAGEAAKFYVTGSNDWLFGADMTKEAGKSLRYFADPTLDGVSIDHVEDYTNGIDGHYSNGIFNKAFYTLATTPGWTTKKGFDLFVLANQVYWKSSSSLENCLCGLIYAARDLSFEQNDIVAAFNIVGLHCNDMDADQLRDDWEVTMGLDPTDPSDANEDPDHDGYTNTEEQQYNRHPFQPNVSLSLFDLVKITEFNNSLISYKVVVTNYSQATAHNVVVDHTLPAGVIYTSHTAPTGVVCGLVGTILRCNISELAYNQQVSMTINVTAANSKTLYPFKASAVADETDFYGNDKTRSISIKAGSVGLMMLAALVGLALLRRQSIKKQNSLI